MSDSWWLKTPEWRAVRKHFIDNTPEGGYICHLCSKRIDPYASGRTKFGLSVDHIVPTSRGGSLYDLNNLAAAHIGCNSGKREGRTLGGKTTEPYRAPFRRRSRRAPGTTPKARQVTPQPITIEPVEPDDVTGSQIW